jgi:hypothetical protein
VERFNPDKTWKPTDDESEESGESAGHVWDCVTDEPQRSLSLIGVGRRSSLIVLIEERERFSYEMKSSSMSGLCRLISSIVVRCKAKLLPLRQAISDLGLIRKGLPAAAQPC